MQVKSPFGKTQAALKEPSSDYDQATKKYVDESIVDHRNDTSVHLTLAQNTWLDGINATQAEVNYLSGVTSSVQGQLNTKLSLSGGTLTGALVLSANPTLNLGAATKQYVDVADAASKDRANHTGTQAISTITDLQNQINLARGLAAGTSSQDPNIAVDNVIVTNHANTPNASFYWHITTTFYDGNSSVANRGQIAVQATGGASVYARSSYSGVWTGWERLDNAGVSASQISTGVLPDGRLSGVYTNASVGGNAGTATKLQTARAINGVSFDGSTNITISDTTKLPLAGGTLTGLLTLSGAPTVALHAATKQYVDDGLALKAPLTDTKQYVDDGLALKAPLTGAGTSGTWPIAISGNAATATTASVSVAPTFTGPLSGYSLSDANTGSASNGVVFRYLTSGATNKPTGTDHALMSMNYSATFAGQMAADWRTNNWYVRTLNNGSWTQWETVYTSGNLTKATLGLGSVENTADNAKNVLSATKLTTARLIGGVSFDGTANINLPGVNTAGTQATSGNAATATTLQTARTINGVSFNGSANITISDDTKLPTTGGSMSGPVSFNGEYARGNITGAVTIDFTNGQKTTATLTGNSTITFTFPGVGNYQLRLVQDATGNRTVSYANTPKYVGSATAPDINTAPNTETILSLFWSGSAIYLAGSKVNA